MVKLGKKVRYEKILGLEKMMTDQIEKVNDEIVQSKKQKTLNEESQTNMRIKIEMAMKEKYSHPRMGMGIGMEKGHQPRAFMDDREDSGGFFH